MFGRAAFAASVVLIMAVASAQEPSAPAGALPESTAADLVRRALAAERDGDNRLRSELLAKACLADPSYAPARWHSGQIEYHGAWHAVDELANDPGYQQRIEAYRELRSKLAGSLQEHVALAEWCRKSGLADQERLHWFAVLLRDPHHKRARARLQLVEYRGALLTREELEAYKETLDQQEAVEREWTRRVKIWRSALMGSDPLVRQQAEDELQDVADADALPVLEKILAPASADCALQLVSVLQRFEEQAATDALVRVAVFSEFEEARKAASRQLSARSPYSYVPTLLDSLATSVEFSFFVDRSAGDTFFGYEARQEGQHYVISHSFTRGHKPAGLAKFSEHDKDMFAEMGLMDGRKLQSQVAAWNAATEAKNQRIFAVLEQATGQQLERQPQAWWQWWQNQNELQSNQQKPLFQQDSSTVFTQYGLSCFLPGTIVWTDTGGVPIESIRIGDRVLAQNAETGEVSYKLVLNTTIRPPSPTLRIGLGDEEIVGTLGHPIWVIGKGWKMTKQLEPGDRLHGVLGSRAIEYVERGPEAQAHNLVVADFHTYMVGTHRVLVHDNVMRSPTTNPIPGLAE